MKKIILSIFAILVLSGCATLSYAKNNEPQKVDVTITIKCEGKTLKQVVDIENKIRELFNDYESIKIEFNKKEQPYSIYYPLNTDPGIVLTPNLGY